ncbi:glycoprotein endo-alpha-1,2-mannosidase-like protein isoform X3 [Girardinichthys multiradiatus]|uniref:glycoprotein endo-alpha-1,2-mannosidase-like protein isoform X3 n=1 Tax=Girardinichthys multiradiatus TaxID=208333 RepID=UPI001FADD01F|nr:glycoprotein endo-alpha-1,2-mannosidase-like protein isoform X3 [Girardinichthys multiradiatus]
MHDVFINRNAFRFGCRIKYQDFDMMGMIVPIMTCFVTLNTTLTIIKTSCYSWCVGYKLPTSPPQDELVIGGGNIHHNRRCSGVSRKITSVDGVLVLSWYPPGLADDNGEPAEDLVPAVLDAAYRHNLKVAFHIQPYRGRNDQTLHENIKYIIDRYGDHGAFYKFTSSTGKNLPLFYIYDSYLTPPESWSEFLTPFGSHSVRGSAYDSMFIALIVEERHKHDILAGGFDGMYTYFASNGFSFGSSHHNWKAIKAFCDGNNLLFIPSVGPGYTDTSIRPWNNHNTRNRVNGRYYETALQAALNVRPEVVTITSFNEWHEGTQIERAMPKKTVTRVYLDYQPHGPEHYLELTRSWAEQFKKEKQQWLM